MWIGGLSVASDLTPIRQIFDQTGYFIVDTILNSPNSIIVVRPAFACVSMDIQPGGL